MIRSSPHLSTGNVGITTRRWYEESTVDWKTDGHLLGDSGRLYGPGSGTAWLVPGIKPDNGKTPTEKVFSINGIMTRGTKQRADSQAIANATGTEVIGIRNATEGMLRDVVQCVTDFFGLAKNAAVDTAARVILEGIQRNEPHINFAVHSQGAIILSRAVGIAQEALRAKGRSPEEIVQLMHRVRVLDLAGAPWRFVPGPKFLHVINNLDAIPRVAGIGLPGVNPGEDAEFIRFRQHNPSALLPPWWHGLSNLFARYVDNSFHGLVEVYAPKVASSEAKDFFHS